MSNSKKIKLEDLQKENEKRLANGVEAKVKEFDIFDNIDIFEELSKSLEEIDQELTQTSSEEIDQELTQTSSEKIEQELTPTNDEKVQKNSEQTLFSQISNSTLNESTSTKNDFFEEEVIPRRSEAKKTIEKLDPEILEAIKTDINKESSIDVNEYKYQQHIYNNLKSEVENFEGNTNQGFENEEIIENETVNFSSSIVKVEDQEVFQIQADDFYTNGNSVLLFVYENEELSQYFNLGFKDEHINKSFGKVNKINTLGKSEFTNIYFVGLGKQEELNDFKLESLFKNLVKEIDEDVNVDLVTWQYPNQVLVIDKLTKAFCDNKYKVNKITKNEVRSKATNKLFLALNTDLQNVIDVATISSQSQAIAKDLMYLPSNVLTPDVFVEYIKKSISDLDSVNIDIKDTQTLLDEGFGLITAVNQGSNKNAYLVTLEYNGVEDQEEYKTIIGKGITFDTGGYSLKPVNSMLEMHTDMGGSAISLATFIAVCKLNLKINLRCVLVITENVVNGLAYKVEDVLISKSGKTVQIKSTDAEGRLVLADALTHAQSFKTDEVITIATLTASNYLTDYEIVPLFSNSGELTNELIVSGEVTQDYLWPMPLNHFNNILSSKVENSSVIADCANKTPKAGSPMIYGANFIYSFVEEKENLHFAHLDIGGQVSQNGEFTTPTLRALINYYMSLQA